MCERWAEPRVRSRVAFTIALAREVLDIGDDLNV
jgi:hypothetical protein